MKRAIALVSAGIVILLAVAVAALATHGQSHRTAGSTAAPVYQATACPPAIVAVFLDPATFDSHSASVREHIRSVAPKARMAFVDQAAGYREYQALFADTPDADMLNLWEIPPSWRVATDPATATRIMTAVRSDEGVEDVADLERTAPRSAIDVETLIRLGPHAGTGCQRLRH